MTSIFFFYNGTSFPINPCIFAARNPFDRKQILEVGKEADKLKLMRTVIAEISAGLDHKVWYLLPRDNDSSNNIFLPNQTQYFNI